MTRVRLATLATLVLSLTILLPSTALAAPTLVARVVQDGLTNPWDVAFAPGGQMFVTTRPGRVRVYASGSPNARGLATSTITNVRAEGEAGVMGIAIDPLFSTNRFVFVCASRTFEGQWRNQVIRYHVTSGWKLQFNRYIIKTGMVANTIHNGCAVQVGPDPSAGAARAASATASWGGTPARRATCPGAARPIRGRSWSAR